MNEKEYIDTISILLRKKKGSTAWDGIVNIDTKFIAICIRVN